MKYLYYLYEVPECQKLFRNVPAFSTGEVSPDAALELVLSHGTSSPSQKQPVLFLHTSASPFYS